MDVEYNGVIGCRGCRGDKPWEKPPIIKSCYLVRSDPDWKLRRPTASCNDNCPIGVNQVSQVFSGRLPVDNDSTECPAGPLDSERSWAASAFRHCLHQWVRGEVHDSKCIVTRQDFNHRWPGNRTEGS